MGAEELEGPVAERLRTLRVGKLPERPVNNARIIAGRIYRTPLELFDRWYEQHGRDVRVSVASLDTLMHGVVGDSAYARLERASRRGLHKAMSSCPDGQEL